MTFPSFSTSYTSRSGCAVWNYFPDRSWKSILGIFTVGYLK